MRTSVHSASLSICAALLLLLTGCASETETPNPQADTSASADTASIDDTGSPTDTVGTIDSGPTADTPTTPEDTAGASDTGATACKTSGFETKAESPVAAFYPKEVTPWFLIEGSWFWRIPSTDGSAFLDMRPGKTVATQPAVYTVKPDECELCLRIQTDCNDDGCSTEYYAVKGEVEVKSIELKNGGAVEVVLTDMVFMTEGGDTWCMSGSYQGSLSAIGGTGLKTPELKAPDQAGNDVALSSFQGKMTVVLWNFNSWCPPCRWAAEASEALWKEYDAEDDRYDVSFVQLLMDDGEGGPATQEDAASWATEYGITYPVLHGQVIPDLWDSFFADWLFTGLGLPAYWVIDPMGEIRAYYVGFNEKEGAFFGAKDIQAHFEQFLEENPDWKKAEPAAACEADTCQNDGTCEVVDGKVTCTCKEGFSGDNCETDIDDCADDPCLNGGTCTDGVASYTCDCTGTGFTGPNCAEAELSVNGCTLANSKKMTDVIEVTLSWGFGTQDCIIVNVGTTVTFDGNLNAHPLSGGAPGEPDATSPITAHDKGLVTFTEAGSYGYYCEKHASMKGAIFVQ